VKSVLSKPTQSSQTIFPHDVFNALDLMQNLTFLKYGIGDGSLQYYLRNWRMGNAQLQTNQVGLLLL
jgi:hypothetical protein